MYVLVQNGKVVNTYASREGAECVKTNAQIVIYTEKKKVRIGSKASALRR
jgi:hypothetical protein